MSKAVFKSGGQAACACVLGLILAGSSGMAFAAQNSTQNSGVGGRASAQSAEPEVGQIRDGLSDDNVDPSLDDFAKGLAAALAGETAEVPTLEAHPVEPPPEEGAVIEPTQPSASAERMAGWIASSGDAGGLPFIIIDKVAAIVAVYTADGSLQGATPALVGLAPGDDSVPGIGLKPLNAILNEEKTTPAGRFPARIGRAASLGGEVLWVDFAAAVALHPMPKGTKKEQRADRMLSPSPDDNRITFGCINVAPDFYAAVVKETLTEGKGVVYILPDTKPMAAVFPSYAMHAGLDAPPAAQPVQKAERAPEAEAPALARVSADAGEAVATAGGAH